ncbi:hypothetical protein AYK26_02455 [Euryarchaeota archaeon SM23-78]|nr:MAG: hypothetical protein AYK26_02455 [Euryarchaeota archaeon SM23-78]MBW3000681.1 hypothetical protein [Candidatus Woesearchaeota archaeon]
MTIHFAVSFFDEKTEDAGYLLGSDSNWDRERKIELGLEKITIEAEKDFPYFADKVFKGEKHIGIFSGKPPLLAFSMNQWAILHQSIEKKNEKGKESDKDKIQSTDSALRFDALNHVFDNIGNNTNYSQIEFLKAMGEQKATYSLLIATQRNDVLELFVVSNEKGLELKKDAACQLHKIEKTALDKHKNSMFWIYGPGVPSSLELTPKGYYECEYKKKLNLREAKSVTLSHLQPSGIMKKLIIGTNENYDPGPSNIYLVSYKRLEKLKTPNLV